ncbi:uncharacterized protein LOC143179108 [Calliopsis andreniformis]|uniref:uncharacterized protein LOC143179108 n=1 Tax=Calliopsis andreniformis TaxID=337506 RepID=UPI003FCDE0D9
MASNMQSFPRILKMLRETSNIKDRRESLTYIRSNSKKLESTKAIKEEQYKELCKLIVDAFANGNSDIQNEAYETLNVIIRDFKDHSLNLFEAMSQISQKNRLKILKLLEVVEDNAISAVAYDVHAVNFFNNCMCTIQPNAMPWTAPTACVDNLQVLIEAESRPLSDDQRLEEETINFCITLLRRLYKVAAITSDTKVQRFDGLLLDKVMVLAYMGHKRQRGPALKLLQQALATNIISHVRTKLVDAWARYKAALQSAYCKRMLLLVSACETDWATQWNISIQFLGVDLHRGAGLINNLLSVEEKAFKSTDTIIRRQAFLSWKLLVDNFALDPQELATARRIKLLCIPLNAKNSKNELIALTKLEVWWHVIIKLYKDISKFVNPVITQFLNFCFGPLGDTPLLSSKCDIMASPGKRFFKTKVVAVDALCQLLVTKQENHVFSPILEERLPHSISDSVFQECYKSIIHSVGEALLVLSQLTDAEMKKRYQLGKILWTSLVNYIQESKMKEKELMYKNMILVITELTDYAVDKLMIRDLILDTVLFEIADLSKNFNFQDDTLSALMLKLLQIPILNEAQRNHYDAIKYLLWQCIKSPKENQYYLHAFKYLKKVYERLCTLSNVENKNDTVIFELWRILAEVLTKYMDDQQEINEGNSIEHNLKTVESIVVFPFMYISLENEKQVQELLKAWKCLYKQFEMRADLIATVKSNEILLNIANAMELSLVKNEKSCHLIINCLDTLLNTVNYKFLLAHTEISPIMHLILKLTTCSLSSKNSKECESALKALSAVLITIYGHNPQKVVSYLQASKSVVELIIKSDIESLHKEVANTWDTVISILKGLNKLLDYDLLLSYKTAILHALNHPNLDIQLQTVSFFEIRNVLSGDAKVILEEVEKEANKNKASIESDIIEKDDLTETLPNQVNMVGSFLNRESNNLKSTLTETEKRDKKIIPNTDSQDYVLIKTDLKFDVDRLTEHQKESLKRRREDIPALYNDLSQSSSQDTQNLQEWFDKRNVGTDAEKTPKKDNFSLKKILNYDANKENKLEEEKLEVTTKPNVQNDIKSTENVKHNLPLDSTPTAKTTISNNENSPVENTDVIAEKTCDNLEVRPSLDSAANELSIHCEEEFPDSKNNDQRLSPSILDHGKRRSRPVIRSSTSPKSEEIVSSQPGQSNSVQPLQRTLRPKLVQTQLKMVNKKAPANMVNVSLEEDKRGIKRKSVSDSESEGINQRRRRKSNLLESVSDSDSCKSTESDSTVKYIEEMIEVANLSQRTKNEISRLRINMVFDSPLANSRRSKGFEDKEVRKHSPETKGTKLRVGDQKTGDPGRRTPKNNDKEPNNVQLTNKKGRQTKTKVKIEKNNKLNKTEDTKKVSQNKRNELEEKKKSEDEKKRESAHAESKIVASTSTAAFNDHVSNNGIHSTDVDLNEDITHDQNNKSVNEKLQSQCDVGDIVENSQELSILEKRCNEKKCFIKINKISDVSNIIKLQETVSEDDEVAKIVSNNCNNDDDEVPKDNVNGLEENTEISADKPKNTTPVNENNAFDNDKDILFEEEKVNEGLSAKSASGFSSPKSNIRRQLKFKPYSPQGRAAHMLGLVTKQARIESECPIINIDDDSVIKKPKTKDSESETLIGKKERCYTLKEVDKVAASCSSRQEKIFNNMRSSDYCSSPPIKLFSNLKNDGEKIFTKIDKSMDCTPIETDNEAEKPTEETLLEMDELPMLEWSNANPPSLTASPSASILKRSRQVVVEPDPESMTPNKRKRVSFADPPVSKEMGYEIRSCESPQRVTKFIPRGFLGRKDSPLRLKQVRQKLIHMDMDKMETDETSTVDNSEIDLQCERENEMLTKIAEELEYSESIAIDTDTQATGVFIENESVNDTSEQISGCNKIDVDNLSGEFEITRDSVLVKNTDLRCVNTVEYNKNNSTVSETSKSSNISLENTEFENMETQDDIFNGIDAKGVNNIEENKNNNNITEVQKISIQDNLLDSSKLSIINDSIRNQSFEKFSENLEDTVDTENVTGLNSTASSDEIFCGRLIRTSTQAAENVAEQDTLPVTDSVFESLPLSQDSQNTSNFNAEIPDPELLNSTEPIYPALVSCSEPIKVIIGQLTNPLWVQHLSTYFLDRNLQTVGDLAQLSEREINRIPVKGHSKTEFIKSVLKWFEKTHNSTETNNTLNASTVPGSTTEFDDQAMHESPETIQNTPPNQRIPIIQITDIAFATDKNTAETTQDTNMSTSDEPLDVYELNTCPASQEITCDNAPTINKDAVTTKTVGTCTSSDTIYSATGTTSKATKSVAAQMALEDLLDEIDVNLVLESAVRRCTPEKILLQYKNKMRHVSQVELERETIRLLGAENRKNGNEVTLKAACRAYGVNKVLLRLPDIFSSDKQFFVKVLNAYRKKIKANDCLNILDLTEVKDAVVDKCSSSDLAEMLSKKLKEEEQEGIKEPMTELSSLDAMLKRMPMDVIISHTVANDELIPSRVVLDIALQNNSSADVAQALESQSSLVTKSVFDKLWSSQFATEHIEEHVKSKEDLLKIFKAVSSKLDSQELLQAFYESMNVKVAVKGETD